MQLQNQAELAPVDSAVHAVGLESLNELFDAHHRFAYGLAYRILHSRQDAEEVVQEAFLSVWRRSATFDQARGSTRTWVLHAVRNRAIDVLRARKRRPPPSDFDTDVQDSGCDVAATAVANVDQESMLRALVSLSPSQRNVVELAYFGGLSHTQIARLLDLPVGTVKGRIRLALDHLRLLLPSETSVLAA